MNGKLGIVVVLLSTASLSGCNTLWTKANDQPAPVVERVALAPTKAAPQRARSSALAAQPAVKVYAEPARAERARPIDLSAARQDAATPPEDVKTQELTVSRPQVRQIGRAHV